MRAKGAVAIARYKFFDLTSGFVILKIETADMGHPKIVEACEAADGLLSLGLRTHNLRNGVNDFRVKIGHDTIDRDVLDLTLTVYLENMSQL